MLDVMVIKSKLQYVESHDRTFGFVDLADSL